MIDRYWSPVQLFSISPVVTVEMTMLRVLLRREVMAWVMVNNIPDPIIAPPKHMAHRISMMVGSIPSIPPVEARASSCSFPVAIEVDVTSSRPGDVLDPSENLRLEHEYTGYA